MIGYLRASMQPVTMAAPGTTGASLRAGVPTIIRPFFGDQFFWASRVEALGIGTGLRKMTVDSLASALHAATTNEKQIARAKLVGASIREVGAVSLFPGAERGSRPLGYKKMEWKRPLNPCIEILSMPSP